MGSSLSQFGFGQTYVNNKQAIKGDPQDPTQGDMVKGKSGWSKNNETTSKMDVDTRWADRQSWNRPNLGYVGIKQMKNNYCKRVTSNLDIVSQSWI